MNTLCVTAVLWAAGTAVAVPPPSMSFHGTGSLDGFSTSQIFGVSGDGSVAVGMVSEGNDSLPVMWTLGGGLHSLGTLPGSGGSLARAVNYDGSVIVGQSSQRAFRWTQGTGAVDLGTLASNNQGFASAWGVTDDGNTVIGTAAANSGFNVFRWQNGSGMSDQGYFDASAISADGNAFVAIDSRPGGGFVGLRVVEGTGATDLGQWAPQFDVTAPHAISRDASRVVGHVTQSGEDFNFSLAFQWREGVGLRLLQDFVGGSTLARANDLTDDGSLIVGFGSDVVGRQAAIWVNGAPAVRAQDFLLSMGVAGMDGWRLTDVSGISPDGLTLVGTGINPDGLTEGWVARIPGAPTASLLAVNLLLVRRRRR